MPFTSVDDQTRENNLKLKPVIFWLCLRKFYLFLFLFFCDETGKGKFQRKLQCFIT